MATRYGEMAVHRGDIVNVFDTLIENGWVRGVASAKAFRNIT